MSIMLIIKSVKNNKRVCLHEVMGHSNLYQNLSIDSNQAFERISMFIIIYNSNYFLHTFAADLGL